MPAAPRNFSSDQEGGDQPSMSPVTVVIVNWNSGDMLTKCLRHLAAQTVQPEHVLVIDNDNSGGSAVLPKTLPQVMVRRMKTNLGFAGGNNRALAECDTEFVALLNPDAFPEPEWLERMLAAARARPDVAAFGSCQLRYDDPEVLDGIGDCYYITGKVWREGYGARRREVDPISREIFSPCAAAAFYRRQALLKVGGFDEDYFCYVEDVDLGFRLRLAGYKALYVPDAVVHHVGSATTGGRRSAFYVYHGHRNLVWTFVKNMPGSLFWLLLPLHVLLNIFSVIYFVFYGQASVIFRAKRDAMRSLPRMWRKRQQIQGSRVVSIAEVWRMMGKRIGGFPRSRRMRDSGI